MIYARIRYSNLSFRLIRKIVFIYFQENDDVDYNSDEMEDDEPITTHHQSRP